jgi:hypothetical protein
VLSLQPQARFQHTLTWPFGSFHQQGSHDEHDEDEFGEYDEFEMVGTAAPYIPPKTEEKVVQKPAPSKKQANYDDEEFEGSAMGHMDFEKVPELKIDNTGTHALISSSLGLITF